MKIYLYDPETRVYLGEDFTDEAPVGRGAPPIPPGATTIAPPEGGRGHIMVFDDVAQCWEVHSQWGREKPDDDQSASGGRAQ
ncbi:MAG TPA: hypothetical protein VF795_06190 [Desulfuromonadaceae bacterium]